MNRNTEKLIDKRIILYAVLTVLVIDVGVFVVSGSEILPVYSLRLQAFPKGSTAVFGEEGFTLFRSASPQGNREAGGRSAA